MKDSLVFRKCACYDSIIVSDFINQNFHEILIRDEHNALDF